MINTLDRYLAEVAFNEVKILNENEEFMMRDLFRKSEWEILPLTIRQQAGLRFFEKLDNKLSLIPNYITYTGKVGEATKYKKIKNF